MIIALVPRMTKRYHRYLFRPKDIIHFSAILLSGKGSFSNVFLFLLLFFYLIIFGAFFSAKTKLRVNKKYREIHNY